MLFTRCPECETTFRLTDETLKKANGQVRCGRCASVFNAYAELRDPNAKSFDRAEPDAPAHRTAPKHEPPPAAAAAPPPDPPISPTSPEPLEQPADAVTTDAVAASLGVDSVADIVAQVEQATAIDNAPETAEATAPSPSAQDADSDAPISAREVDAVLTSPVVVRAPSAGWPPLGSTGEEPPRRSRWWGAAAAVAFVTLAAQVVHHSRTDIAAHPTIGPWLQGAYAALGVEVNPRWDVHQYAILDWVATAEPNARGLGSLKITAHIQNRGPLRQPYPAVQLKLKDRWEEAVGSRLFAPAEYLSSDTPRGRLMLPGETARAEIEVVDPGPDAYGFELDVCIEVEASSVSCGTDEVFL